MVRVPLIIAEPGWPEGVAMEENTSLLDRARTILAKAAGAPSETVFEGRDLLPLRRAAALG